MRRSLLALLIAAAACGGKQKSTTPPPTLPDDKPPVAEVKPEEPKEPEGPPAPKGPIEIPIPARQVEVKLVSAGKGKKAKLVLSPKAGVKQVTELAIDFSGGQDGPPETGGKTDDVAPTALLTAEVETKEVSPTGQTKFVLTFSAADAKERTGQKVDTAQFKTQMTALVGATITGAVDADGQLKDAMIRVEKPDAMSVGGLQFLALSMMPMWPVLPAEPVGPGAKWTVTTAEKIVDQIDITKVVTYELVSKKGPVWTIKGSTAITGKDQKMEPEAREGEPKGAPTTIGNISGAGKHEISLSDGSLLPTVKQTLSTKFTITAEVRDPDAKTKEVVLKFYIDQLNALTPKT